MADRERQIDNTQRLVDLQRAIREERIYFPPELGSVLREIMAVSLQPGQVLLEDRLSEEALSLVRTTAMAMRATRQDEGSSVPVIGATEAQVALFELFAEVFSSITGRSHDTLDTLSDVRDATRAHVRADREAVDRTINAAMERLDAFYREHAKVIFEHAKELGGVKSVLGGQRAFGPSAFGGIRKMALYMDTQLIPDPIYPFFETDLNLKARHVELLTALYHVLQLKPLVDAQLPVPPILVFQSFEKSLEINDVQTQVGICELVLQVLRPACNATIESMDDLMKYALGKPDEFMQAVMRGNLFVPPGVSPGEMLDSHRAIERYLAEIGSSRAEHIVSKIARMPPAEIMITGITERLTPQYHLIENGDALQAQPLLTQLTHWHYFDLCAQSSAVDLNHRDILSADSLRMVRALQDQKLTWLENVPMPALLELLKNQENIAFRKELSEYTKMLFAAGVEDIDRVVREVSHGIESMVQAHQKTIADIEKKYAQKYQETWMFGGSSLVLGVAALFLPMLAAFAPPSLAVASVGVMGKLAVTKVQEQAEKRRTRHSLLGILATTPRQ